jgi:hypothetical protein
MILRNSNPIFSFEAQILKDKDKDLLKAGSFFGFAVLLVVSLLMNLSKPDFWSVTFPAGALSVTLFAVLGYYLWRSNSGYTSFNVFLLTGMYLLSMLISWFAVIGLIGISLLSWVLFLSAGFLAGWTFAKGKITTAFGIGVAWAYAALMILLFVAVAGMAVNWIHLGFMSQGFTWNLAVALLAAGALISDVRKLQNYGAVVQVFAALIAVAAVFVFSGVPLGLLA